MKARFKRLRALRKAVGRTVRAIVVLSLLLGVLLWLAPHWPRLGTFLARVGVTPKIEIAEIDRYYDLLAQYAPPGEGMVVDLGVGRDGALQTAIDRLKRVMGLGEYTIWLAHHDAAMPPAYIKDLGYGDMGILISSTITERREELNLLVHELGHIYVRRLDQSVFARCDQEKLVDCAGIYLGLGILTLNGLTNDFAFVFGGGYETKKRAFGYLTPEQFGYLCARYCASQGIAPETIAPYLATAGRNYFAAGCAFRARAGGAMTDPVRRGTAIRWCERCGAMVSFALDGMTVAPVCSHCGIVRE